MLWNYLISALRNMQRHKLSTFISIFGLGIGLACAIILFLALKFVFSFNSFHEDVDSIYSVYSKRVWTDGKISYDLDPGIGGRDLDALSSDIFPQIRQTLILPEFSAAVSAGGEEFDFYEILVADPRFFEFFNFPPLTGTANSMLRAPNSIVLTKNEAYKLFGSMDVIGRELTLRHQVNGEDAVSVYTVSGVLANIPPNSTLRFSALVSPTAPVSPELIGPEAHGALIFLKLAPGADIDALNARLGEMTWTDSEYEQWKGFCLGVTSFRDILMFSDSSYRGNQLSSYLRIAGVTIVFLLIIICINVINLQTARFSRRGKEIGVRKSFGARKKEIIVQLLSETMLLCLFGLILALFFVEIGLAQFNAAIGVSLWSLNPFHPVNILSIVLFTIFVGFLSGFYGAFVLSSLEVVNALRSTSIRSGRIFKVVSIIIQMALTTLFIIVLAYNTLEMRGRMRQNFGYRVDGLGIVNLNSDLMADRYKMVRDELMKIDAVDAVSGGLALSGNYGFQMRLEEGGTLKYVSLTPVDTDFFRVMDTRIIRGRDFSEETGTREGRLIISENAVPLFEDCDPLSCEAILPYEGEVIGICEDVFRGSFFNNRRFQNFYHLDPDYPFRTVYVRFIEGRTAEGVEAMKRLWSDIFPGESFEYESMGEKLKDMLRYSTFGIIATLSVIFTLVAAGLTLMGIIGIMDHEMFNRTKEIGIRRAVGASIIDIILLFSRKYLIYAVCASIPAYPAAYLLMRDLYLRMDDRYIYQPDILPFLIGTAAAVTFTFLVVMIKVGVLSMKKPIESLRYE